MPIGQNERANNLKWCEEHCVCPWLNNEQVRVMVWTVLGLFFVVYFCTFFPFFRFSRFYADISGSQTKSCLIHSLCVCSWQFVQVCRSPNKSTMRIPTQMEHTDRVKKLLDANWRSITTPWQKPNNMIQENCIGLCMDDWEQINLPRWTEHCSENGEKTSKNDVQDRKWHGWARVKCRWQQKNLFKNTSSFFIALFLTRCKSHYSDLFLPVFWLQLLYRKVNANQALPHTRTCRLWYETKNDDTGNTHIHVNMHVHTGGQKKSPRNGSYQWRYYPNFTQIKKRKK